MVVLEQQTELMRQFCNKFCILYETLESTDEIKLMMTFFMCLHMNFEIYFIESSRELFLVLFQAPINILSF